MNIIEWLASQGVTIGYASTGAIRLPNGKVAFVTERDLGNGKIRITVMQPASRNCPDPYYQRFTARERALKAILAHTR